MNKIFLLLTTLFTFSAMAVDGYYLGIAAGHVALSGKASDGNSNSLGLNLEASVRANPILDVAFNVHYSPHSGGLSIWGEYVSANFHVLEANDFDLTVGTGPGFYTFKKSDSETLFGLHAGVAADLQLGEHLRLGLGTKFHGIFSPQNVGGNFFTVMARIGYFFPVE